MTKTKFALIKTNEELQNYQDSGWKIDEDYLEMFSHLVTSGLFKINKNTDDSLCEGSSN